MKFYEKEWFMWLSLVLFAPIGIWLLYKFHDRYNSKTKKYLSIGFGIFFVIMLLVASEPTSDNLEENNNLNNSPQEQTESIIIKDGELGEYGEKVEVNDNEYIHYKIPTGTYTVKWLDSSTARGGTLYVEKDEPVINDDGYTEYTNSMYVEFNWGASSGDYSDKEITVTNDEHISITLNSKYELMKK